MARNSTLVHQLQILLTNQHYNFMVAQKRCQKLLRQQNEQRNVTLASKPTHGWYVPCP